MKGEKTDQEPRVFAVDGQYREGTIHRDGGTIALCEYGSCTYGIHHPNLQVAVDAVVGHRRTTHSELYATLQAKDLVQ